MKKQKNENSTVFNVSSEKLVANVIQMLDSNPTIKTDMAFSARDIWTEALPMLLSKLPQSTMIIVDIVDCVNYHIVKGIKEKGVYDSVLDKAFRAKPSNIGNKPRSTARIAEILLYKSWNNTFSFEINIKDRSTSGLTYITIPEDMSLKYIKSGIFQEFIKDNPWTESLQKEKLFNRLERFFVTAGAIAQKGHGVFTPLGFVPQRAGTFVFPIITSKYKDSNKIPPTESVFKNFISGFFKELKNEPLSMFKNGFNNPLLVSKIVSLTMTK